MTELSILGTRVPHPVGAEALETFPAPAFGIRVTLEATEFTSLCPVTGQPDFGRVVIAYTARDRCVESKSLKLYLWGYRDGGAFCEALAVQIRDDLVRALDPVELTVDVYQNVRGGIETTATAEHPDA